MKIAHYLDKSKLLNANVVISLGLAFAVTGCVSQTPKVDSKFGDSFEKAKQGQRLEPTAAQRSKPAPAVTSSEVQRAVTSQTTGLPPGAVGTMPGAPGAMMPGAQQSGSTNTGFGSTSGTTGRY